MKDVTFRSARLVGRAPSSGAKPLYAALFGDNGETRLSRHILDWERHNVAPWTLSHAGQDVGVGGFLIGFGGDGLELSFYFIERVQGQGLASEFVRAALDYGADILRADRFYALLEGNTDASRRILERFGFRDRANRGGLPVMSLRPQS